MPQLGEPKKKERTRKPKEDSKEVVSAYSEEGRRRTNAVKRKNAILFAVSLVVSLALIAVFALLIFSN